MLRGFDVSREGGYVLLFVTFVSRRGTCLQQFIFPVAAHAHYMPGVGTCFVAVWPGPIALGARQFFGTASLSDGGV